MKKILFVVVLTLSLFSCKENNIALEENKNTIKYGEVSCDTIYDFGGSETQIRYELVTNDYNMNFSIDSYTGRELVRLDKNNNAVYKDNWLVYVSFENPLKKDYKLTIDGCDLFFHKDGNGYWLNKDVSNVKYSKAWSNDLLNFDLFLINQIKDSKKVSIQFVGESPIELKGIQKDATKYVVAYKKATSGNVDWVQLEKEKYKSK